jgi:hypothetical protein
MQEGFADLAPFWTRFADMNVYCDRRDNLIVKTFLALFVGLALATGCLAADIKPGATVQVKANEIWFTRAAQLDRWHQLKKGGNTTALAAYQRKLLGDRDTWQFTNPLSVKILGYDAARAEVHVKMLTEGRLVGTEWFLDPDAIAP